MPMPPASPLRLRVSLPFVLLSALLLVLWVAGGASRADAAGQIIVRSAAVLLLAGMALFGARPDFVRARAVWLLLAAILALPLLQLVPLPPAVWQALPGRAVIIEAAAASGQPQPWRPLSMAPGLTINAAASLIVPVAALVLAAGLAAAERPRAVAALLAMIVATTLTGLLQFSGALFDNPLINETVGLVSGNFANRNHFALFLALGCVLAPVWAVWDGRRPGWRGPAALGLVLLFMLTVLASGSRAGLLLAPLALALGLVLARRGLRRELGRFPRWVSPALIVAVVALIAGFILVSVVFGRAESVNRAMAIDLEHDMRGRGLPTVLAMIGAYFPAGTGLGTFDPLFRLHEPFALLKPTYFNHAHDDLLEVVLDAGLPGLLLLVAALGWWAWASVAAWRGTGATDRMLPRLGSAILLLVIVASIFDYPARTPIIMAVVALAAEWLGGTRPRPGSALP